MEAGGAMAEVGLLPFARIALQVSWAVLPRYRSRFSKHQFNQPQLLAILCLMRYEDWTFREAEVRLGEHRELRQTLGAQSVIPAKRGKKTWRVHGVRAEMRRAFPQHLYRRRSLIESLFSSVKRKLSARAPGRSLRTQVRQALLLGLSFNLYRLKHRYLFPRMSTEPRLV
jgi:hypothetical protein